MNAEKLSFSAYRSTLFDFFGNRRHVHMIARYERYSGGRFRETERFTTDAGTTFVIDDKIYFHCGDSLIPMNIDSSAPNCGAYERIVGEVHILCAITNNESLYTADDRGAFFSVLHKQTYSDGTAFYCLLSHGDFFPDHGNSDPHALAAQLRKDADPKKGRFPNEAEMLLLCASILDKEPDPIPDPKKNGVILSFLSDKNPLGATTTKTFDTLDEAVAWAKRNVPPASAGWTVYSVPAPGQIPLGLYDYRRTA